VTLAVVVLTVVCLVFVGPVVVTLAVRVVPLEQIALEPGEHVDRRDRVVVALQRRGQVLCPRELGAVEVDERVRRRDVRRQGPVGGPPVAELAHVDRVLEARVLARDLVGPVVEGEERGVPGVERLGAAVRSARAPRQRRRRSRDRESGTAPQHRPP
jgi:hypothetical protein